MLPSPTSAASAKAESFALWISAAARRSRTRSRSPAVRKMDEPPGATARGETVTTSLGRAFSSVTSAVISFVMLAIAMRRSALRS